MKLAWVMVCTLLLGASGSDARPIYVDRDPFSDSFSVKKYKPTKVARQVPAHHNIRIKVLGIVWDETHPNAILSFNGKSQIVGVGDRYLSRKIIKITKKKVWLKGKTKTSILAVDKGKRK